jgi:hypothetical protein
MGRRNEKDSWLDLIPATAGFILVLAVFALIGINKFLILIFSGFFLLIAGGCGWRFWRRTENREQNGETEPATPGNCGALPPSVMYPLKSGLLKRLRSIDWYQFENIIAIVYRKSGFKVERRGGANADGGIDLILVNGAGERTAIQCKQWRTWKVPVKAIREFIGAMKIAGIRKGIFITLRGYTQDSREIAKCNGIELLDEAGLVRLLESSDCRFDPEFIELINDTKKVCPKCDNVLVVRTAKKGSNVGSKFWGCSTYPRCHFTMSL